MAVTIATQRVANAFRLRLLIARSESGAPTLAERLSGGLHIGSPPDNANYPYGALRVLNVRRADVDAPFFTADVEVQLFYRPRSEHNALQDATDLAVEVLVDYVDLSQGIHDVDVRDSDVLPPFSEGADPEVIMSRTMFSALLFPPALT